MTAVGLGAIVLAMLILRQNIILMLLVAAAYTHLVWGDGQVVYLIEDMWAALDSEVLLAIPMFMLTGATMSTGSSAQRLIDVVRAFTEWLPGGMAIAAVLSCAVFSSISGSSAVTLLAVGTVLYPALKDAGYDKRYALGSLASAGTLGIIIPPSIPLIIYGIITETSIADLFLAGIVPGLLLTAILSFYGFWRNRQIAPTPFSWTRAREALKEGIWAMLLPIILLGGIYSGYFAPTEAAAVALAYALIVELFIHRELGFLSFFAIFKYTAQLLGSIFPILAVALSLKSLLAVQGVPQEFAAFLQATFNNEVSYLLAVNLALLIVGCFVDAIPAILILGPLFYAGAATFGIHPVHFGIIMVVNLELGFLTPPIGLNLIVAMTAFKEKFSTVAISVLPFLALMLVFLTIVTFVPELSMWLVR
ncbi:TRAP transporter large permease [Thalassovita sp.]|uniref:TRAP transporter large permease n=1 Tax=Thalassovita sp. TaxID=1979401 RepID=UPI0029DE6CC7|nr:TRAP transporter large permease [Thalassovita sp.]